MRLFAFAPWLLMLVLSPLSEAETTRLLRQPALSADHLAFVYAGDLWLARRDGSEPRRLTSDAADEYSPFFSPDGRWIAFAADYGGNTDVYLISIDGGQPRRLTWHPGDDLPVGWTPDGAEVALVSARETDHGRSGQLFHIPVSGGGLPRKIMAARFYRGQWDATGRRLAYIAHGSGYNGLFGGTAGWRGYRGGTTPSIRILDVPDNRLVAEIPGERVTDFNAFWLDGKVYFISDRVDKRFNLFRFDRDTGDLDQLSTERDWDLRSAAGHDRTVVFEAGGFLKQLDLDTGDVRRLQIEIHPDLPGLRPGWKSVADNIQGIGISPTATRAIVTARGEVFTVPTDEGSTRNLSNSPAVREYPALWSPNGDRIAWIEESLAGQTLVVTDQTGRGPAQRHALGADFYQLEAWHGDTGRIVFSDNHLGLYSISLDSGHIDRLATNARRAGFDVAFSPDGRWLAYTLEQPNFHADLMLYDFEEARSIRVSDGMADVASPAFDPKGRYLYFAASTNSGPIQVGLNMTSQERPYRAGLYAVVLAADGTSPIAPEAGDEQADAGDDNDEDEPSSKKKKSAKGRAKSSAVRIDLEALGDRIVGLPVAEGNYQDLQVAHDGNLYYIQAPQPGASNEPPGEDNSDEYRLLRFDFEDREARVVERGVLGFRIAAGGRHLLLQNARGLAFAEIGKDIKPEPLDLSGLRIHVDPREEWAQIFDEGWRMQRQYFYAENMHGVDWDAVYEKFRPLVRHVGRREDLNALMVEMIAEMQAGHNRIGGGDLHREQGVKTGLLGANFVIDGQRYRIARIYGGEAWNPFLRGPLAEPGNAAREGEYLLAVNGHELTAADNLFRLLEDTVDRQIVLTVGPDANGRNSREIVVRPIEDERALRLWHWIEANRKAVAEATDGRVGYVYLPNTAGAGYTFFNRMFHPQLDKQALIIDERANGGGQAADYIVEVLSRRHLSSWKDRDGLPYNTPAGALHGPKLMLIDQDAGSGGDYLPYAFRELGIGPLIGTRTWGGLIGIHANPPLVDGGVMTVPYFRFVDADGRWSIENEGVAPDIVVELDPVATNQGRDTQLERAIAEALRALEDYRSPVPPVPPLPTEPGR